MNAQSLAIMVLCGLLVSCDERDAQKTPQLPPIDDVSIQKIGQRLKQKASKKIKEMMEAGQPRIVPRSAKPEIILKNDQIRIDGKLVVMGEPIERWKAAIPGKYRCKGEHGDIACDWDDLGITLLAERGMVKHFTVYFNLTPWMEFARTGPDGAWVPPYPDTRPKHPFRGYFELDGYGIDANTQFWEIRASVDPDRNVRCDFLTNNCGTTTARFGGGAIIYFQLYETISERGKLADFTIGLVVPLATDPAMSSGP